MYIKISNSGNVYPYSLQQFRVDNPTYTFPAVIPTETLNDFGIFEVQLTPKPNDYTKNISEGEPVLEEGVYKQNWVQTNASQSEIDLRIERQWEAIRTIRKEKLAECDWTQLGDIPQATKDVWAGYRQDLRDITSQSDPFNINWPVEP